MDETPSPWAFQSPVGWARFGVAFLGIAAAVAAMFSLDNAFAYIEAGLLGLTGLFMVLDRVDVHVALRALLWGSFCAGCAMVMFVTDLGSVGMFAGSAAALLALGSAGLDSERGAFAPKVLRRTLVTMMVVGLSVAHVLMVSAVITEAVSAELLNSLALELPSTLFTRISMFATPLLLVLGVVGLSRTKSWGLFAYVGALAGIVLTIVLAFSWANGEGAHFDGFAGAASTGWVMMMAALWSVSGVIALGAAVPVLTALVFRRKPSSAPPRRWGRYAHAALVCVVVLGTLALSAST